MNRYERLNEERKIIEKRKRVAAYCRVSTDNEDQANSFESQQRYFKQYIERNPDWELYEIFADEGISGTSTKKRKEFNRMIACAKNGDFDLIITKEISRFARNTLDSIYYTRDLKKHGVGVIFMNDNINTLDGDAELRLAIMSSIAQEESRKTSERVKWGQKRQMEQGVVFGRSMLGYDVKDGKMTINEEGAKIVRLIFHKFVNEGKGTHVIARELREEGIEPMRVKEWQNTVILRVIRNEKYCGDLVQKKTYTPDFLSHEKKYNRGQEEFVIIKDHHEPIVSRELFEEANRILDERSLSQEGKAKHSNRYPFSGKIKCGHCGASYVARYKTRKDGSKYKAWRCQEAAKHGSPHTDKAGNQIGCTGASIRNEDATHIMFLVTKELKLRQTKITKNLTSIIESIIAMDTTGTDVEKLKTQIATIEDKRTKLIDIYMSGDISKDEFSAARSKCDAEIAELQSVIDSIDKQQAMIRQQQELVQEIRDAINEIVCGVEYDDEFYKHILDKMVVNDKDNIDVYLNLLPMKWSYTVAKASKKALAPERNISGASVPAEVSGGGPAHPRAAPAAASAAGGGNQGAEVTDMACYIFGAGDFDGLEERPGAEDYVIAADGGYTACRRAGVEPQLLLGDFDSLAEVPALPHVERVPVEKDDTDMMLAVKRGLERGETLFHLYGGMGGQRTDHTVANFQALLYLADHGARGWLHGRGERWTAIRDGSIVFPARPEGILSVFCVGPDAEGVTIRGAQYPLEGATLTASVPLGVSNHFIGQDIMVEVTHGSLLLGLHD